MSAAPASHPPTTQSAPASTLPPVNAAEPPRGAASGVTPSASEQGSSILQQVAAQERRIAELQRQLEDKNQKFDRFQTAKKQEMEALLAGLKDWLTKIGLQSDNDRMEVEKGLQRLVNNGADDNGIWRVMVTASANARQREDEYQQLKIAYDELQNHSAPKAMHVGFDDAETRVGSKRAADEDPAAESSVPDIWNAFIADVNQTGYV